MADTYKCVTCSKTRAGRFTRRKDAAGGGWSKGLTLPAWYCWACLPPGQGRGENEDEMATLKKKPTTGTLPVIDVGAKASTLLLNRREGLAMITPLQSEIEAIVEQGITTPEDYARADDIFSRVQKARKTWKLKMYGTKDAPGPIPSIKAGLDQLYALNREVDQPLETLEDAIEQPMKVFKLAELQEKARIERERREAEAEAQRKIEELTRKQEELKTPAAKAKVEQQILEVAEELDAAQQEPEPELTAAENSSASLKKVVSVIAFGDFIQGVAKGLIPDDCISVNMVKLRQYFKDDPESVAEFPGVLIEDDVRIAGR